MSASIWNPSSNVTTPNASAVAFAPTVDILSDNVQDAIKEVHAAIPAPPTTYATLALAEAAAFAAGTTLRIAKGTYPVAADLTFRVPVEADYGVRIVPATNVDLVFNHKFTAEVDQVFDLSASGSAVSFDPRYTTAGYAEWFGAISNDDTKDAINTVAINKAAVALLKTELMPASYFTNDKLLIALQGHGIVGHSCFTYGGANGESTRIISTSGSNTILQLGPDTYPGSINAMPQGIFAHDLYLGRNIDPVIASDCAGLIVIHTLFHRVLRVKSAESMRGFFFHHCVSSHFTDCASNRSRAGSGVGTDYWYGYYAYGDNSTAGWGLPGGNASVYLTKCSAGCNIAALQTGSSSGFYNDQKYTDLFYSWCEAGECNVGFNFLGTGTTGNDTNNQDVHLDHCIIDSSRLYGLFIKDASEGGTMDIMGLYTGAFSSAPASIYIQNCKGTINLIGGQCLLGQTTAAIGVVIDGSNNVNLSGMMIRESANVGVRLSNANNCRITPNITNNAVTGGPAIQLLNTCSGNYIAASISGKVGAFTYGIQVVGTGDTKNEYNCTGIVDSATSSRKLNRNGTTITATGLSGTNLVSGVMT